MKLPVQVLRLGAVAVAITLVTAGCSNKAVDAPPTIAPAQAADSPPVSDPLPGVVHALPVDGRGTVFDAATATLVVLSGAEVTALPATGPTRTVRLPAAATAIAGDGDGQVLLAGRGGYLRFDIAAGKATPVPVPDHDSVEFTAVARRADGRLVLGSADGTVYTLAADGTVSAQLKMFARVDSLVTQGDTAIVLDRSQTSVTSLNKEGTASAQALRAGEGATTMVADDQGRVLVADTRGGELLVYGVDPLILRQRFPVPDAPYGLAGAELAWVSQTASNTVVGYDLATGIPVEKVRYRTVQQPNSLAFDDASGTLYVVSGAGAGVQVIPSAGAVK
ncbi:hypothetical protein [Mycolicibacterium sp.]|uniref:hypothetical protein n=1 Tax=Mycolicibacterium sp. TaxID=2320850 RepID=UPI003D116412